MPSTAVHVTALRPAAGCRDAGETVDGRAGEDVYRQPIHADVEVSSPVPCEGVCAARDNVCAIRAASFAPEKALWLEDKLPDCNRSRSPIRLRTYSRPGPSVAADVGRGRDWVN